LFRRFVETAGLVQIEEDRIVVHFKEREEPLVVA
jgi:hypothetical protein